VSLTGPNEHARWGVDWKNKMGSVQSVIQCPKCGEYAYDSSIYTSGEEYCFCLHCGYHHYKEFKKTEKGDVIGRVVKTYDLSKEPVLYAAVEYDENYKVKRIIKSMPMKPIDTMKDVEDFTDMYMVLPFGITDDRVPAKFVEFEGTKEYHHVILDGKNNEVLGDGTSWIDIADGKLEIKEAEWDIREGGGFGVVTEWSESGGYSHALYEGEELRITENTIFASAIVDGKLTVLKSYDEAEETDNETV